MESRKQNFVRGAQKSTSARSSSSKTQYVCAKCPKSFSTGQALGGHHAGHMRRERLNMPGHGITQSSDMTTATACRSVPEARRAAVAAPYNIAGGRMHWDRIAPTYGLWSEGSSLKRPFSSLNGDSDDHKTTTAYKRSYSNLLSGGNLVINDSKPIHPLFYPKLNGGDQARDSKLKSFGVLARQASLVTNPRIINNKQQHIPSDQSHDVPHREVDKVNNVEDGNPNGLDLTLHL